VGKKIHDAEVAKHPYMLVVGDREQEQGAVAVRSHAEGDVGTMSIGEFAGRVERAASGTLA
jgi:threonyl-tRNA synthetase